MNRQKHINENINNKIMCNIFCEIIYIINNKLPLDDASYDILRSGVMVRWLRELLL